MNPIEKIKKAYHKYRLARESTAYLAKVIPDFMQNELNSLKADKKILVASIGSYDAKTEAIYAKSLELLGYQPIVIAKWDPFVKKIFKIFGIKKVYFYKDYYKNINLKEIKNKVDFYLKNKKNILSLEEEGILVGKYAASSFMRITRKSSFDFESKQEKIIFKKQLVNSLRAAKCAKKILADIKPEILLVNDRGYNPEGQLFDQALRENISVIQRCGAQKSGYEILKRYFSPNMARIHHHSLSKDSWQKAQCINWDKSLSQELYEELETTYKSGDWFSEVGTQFNKKLYSEKELIDKLGLNPDLKTAIVFPHIFWDATFFWGQDLFSDYHDWFVNVLKVAKENKNLNWIIKIHPANIVKARRDNYQGKHKEMEAVYETLGGLPSHIKIIAPESDINTFSLFAIMDYCLTVRGTIGIEAAAMGVTTLTAGTGRYDRLGFTYDFESKEKYLQTLKELEKLPAISSEKIELARKFAYGVFILRPLYLDLLIRKHKQDAQATIEFKPLFKTSQEFINSKFVKNFNDFVLSKKEDFLNQSK